MFKFNDTKILNELSNRAIFQNDNDAQTILDIVSEYYDNAVRDEYGIDLKSIPTDDVYDSIESQKNYIKNEIRPNDIIFVVSENTYQVTNDLKFISLYDNKIYEPSEFIGCPFYVGRA